MAHQRRSAEPLPEPALSLGGPISDALPVAMAIIRPSDGVLLYSNPAWDTLFGYERGELIGQAIEAVSPLPGKDRDQVRREMLAALAAEGVWHGRVLKQRRSGEQFWSMTHVSVAHHATHGPVWISLQTGAELDDGGVGLDVVEQVAGLGTWELDLGSGTARLSARALRLFNVSEPVEPLTLVELVAAVHPGDLPVVLAALQGAEAGTALDVHFRVVQPDGSVRLLHVRGVEVQSSTSGRVYSGVIIDVTERHAREDNEILLTDPLPASAVNPSIDEQKNLILRAVSHDLRTPLTIMQGFASILVSQDDRLSPEDRRHYAERIEAGASRLQRQLNDLLDLDRLSRGVFEPVRQPTDLCALATECVESLDLGRRVAVRGDRVVVHVDPAQVERILENLLVNAARHTPEDCPIEVSAVYVPDGVLLSVEDGGPGVPADQHEAVFNAFHKVHPDSSGTGVGLALVRRFAEAHQGRAWLEDREGGAAAVRVFLPTVGDAPSEE